MDAQASEKMYEAYYMRVYSYAVTLSGSRELAEEITQETFCRAMTKSASKTASFRRKADEVTWLCTIAKNDEAEYRAYLGYDDFMLVNSIDMTEEDSQKLKLIVEVMMHTIGLWPEGLRHPYKRHGKIFYRPYRNHFDTAPNCDGYWMWERMEKAGHAEARKTGNGEMWHLTRHGLDWLEMKLDMKIYDEED